MGQEVSKRIVPRVTQALQQYEIQVQRAGQEVGKVAAPAGVAGQKAIDPTHPTASKGGVLDDVAGVVGPPEMPPDLLKFLKDAGPLQRTIDKNLTSPKVYESLIKDEEARNEQTRQANVRTRRKMPILSHPSSSDPMGETIVRGDEGGVGDLHVDDGMTTMRTTNFSTRDRSHIGKGFGLTRFELFQMSLKMRDVDPESEEWKKGLESEVQRISVSKKKGDAIGTRDVGSKYDIGGDDAEQSTEKDPESPKQVEIVDKDDMELLQNSLKSIFVPILMTDTDGDIVGVWPSKCDALRLSDLRLAKKNSLEFVLANEGQFARGSRNQ